METLCSKFIIIKAGSTIVTSNNESEVCEFTLLEDLQVAVECDAFYSVEKVSNLPCRNGSDLD